MKEKIEAHTNIETITYEEIFPEHETDIQLTKPFSTMPNGFLSSYMEGRDVLSAR
jgi:hypothetical protein